MFRSFKQIVILFTAVISVQFSPHNAHATTVSDILNTLQQRQLSIQDYDFVVARSFFIEALSSEEIEVMIRKQFDKISSTSTPTPERMAQISRLIDSSALSHSRSKFTGALFRTKGIGLTTHNYVIHTSSDPQDQQIASMIMSPTMEQNYISLPKTSMPDPEMKFGQYQLCLPKLLFNVISLNLIAPPSELPDALARELQRDQEETLFTVPPQSTVTVEENLSQSYRYSCFPFWHEEVLRYATVDNTTIVKENEEEIELLITVEGLPVKLSFHLFCNPEGQVNRFVKEFNSEMVVADYLHYIEMRPEGIEIPQVGRLWMPSNRLDTANPMPEWTRISSILNGRINSGLTLDDLAFEVPAGTTIEDRRAGRKPNTGIVTALPVRLGADLPENINDLNVNHEKETAGK